MTRTLLIDSDIVAYKVASNGESAFDFDGDGDLAISINEQAALKKCEEVINEYANTMKADAVAICLSDPNANWRTDLYPRYKHHRIGARKPQLLFTMKQYMSDEWPSYIRPRLEADDIMGILSTHPSLIPGEKIVVSEDKDLQTIPGLLWNPRKDEKVRRIEPLEADRFWMWQAIVGDACDGYPGAKGCGPKSCFAAGVNAAENFDDMWLMVRSAHAKALGKPNQVDDSEVVAEALMQARLARILRHGDFNYRTKKIRLWKPSTTPS